MIFLKLRSDLYENIGSCLLEIGIDDLIRVYGSSDLHPGLLGRYIDIVKSIARDCNLGLNFHFTMEQRKRLTFHYLDCFIGLTKDWILKSPNAPNFSEENVKKYFGKIFHFFEEVPEFLILRRMRHVACSIYFLSLRLVDINLTIQELLEMIQRDPLFSQMLIYSVCRLNREIMEDFFRSFQRLLIFYKANTKAVVKKLKGKCLFLSQNLETVEIQNSKSRNNVKNRFFTLVLKFMINSKVRKFVREHYNELKQIEVPRNDYLTLSFSDR